MKDTDCVRFLRWALPRLQRPWGGFRKVRTQVCKRVQRRAAELGLANTGDYWNHLEREPHEWERLDALLPITISRFYRDKAVWDYLAASVLPTLAEAAHGRVVRALSLGCASGEEPYTLKLAWHFAVQPRYPQAALAIVATDVVDEVLARAQGACYALSTLRQLPAAWRRQAFSHGDDEYCLRAPYRADVAFVRQDLREGLPAGTFDIIFCRNLLFTYFEEPAQRELLDRMLGDLREGGALVIGRHERLPLSSSVLPSWPGADRLGIYLIA